MPWNASYFPGSMANLGAATHAKAIAIRNVLLAHDEGRAIRIAIAQAKRWASSHRGRKADSLN